MSSRRSDFNLQQTIYLGGLISNKYPRFKLARMTPEYAELYAIIDALPGILQRLDKGEDLEVIKTFIEIFGNIDLMRGITELTLLSMILGNTQQGFDMTRTDK